MLLSILKRSRRAHLAVESRRLALRAAPALLLLAVCFGAQAAEWTLDQLMGTLSAVKSGEARFTERRQVGELGRTMESSGRLSFTAPDIFVRETLKPVQQRLAVNGNQVTMSQGGRSRTAMLDATPEALVVVEAVRGTLTGNRELLERHFMTQLSGTAQSWALELEPRDARLRGQVARVRVQGKLAEVQQVQVLMTDGDRSVMQIEPVAPAAAPASVTR
jgi:outer membrane lipoprotein-sorting protein